MNRSRRSLVPLLISLMVGIWPHTAVPAAEQAEQTSQAAGAEGGHDGRQRLLSSKLKLLDRMVYRAPAVQRIENGDDAEARQLLDAARSAYQRAQERVQRGEFDPAEENINEGLRAISKAARIAADTGRTSQAERERYPQLRERIASFRDAFARVVVEKGPQVAELLDHTKLEQLLQEAEQRAESDSYGAANQHLSEATNIVEAALSKARDKETLLHELKFDSPEAEYAYELERNKSHEMLIALLGAERPVPASALALIEQMKTRNNELRAEADALAARGETEAALETLEEATKNLVRALRIGGLAIP